MHIAFLTDCPLVGNMAYVHRGGNALKGLQRLSGPQQGELGRCACRISCAVLAGDGLVICGAKHPDGNHGLRLLTNPFLRRSWTQLMQGTSSVGRKMRFLQSALPAMTDMTSR